MDYQTYYITSHVLHLYESSHAFEASSINKHILSDLPCMSEISNISRNRNIGRLKNVGLTAIDIGELLINSVCENIAAVVVVAVNTEENNSPFRS